MDTDRRLTKLVSTAESISAEAVGALAELPSLWMDVDKIMNSIQSSSQNTLSLLIFTTVRERHVTIARSLELLSKTMRLLDIREKMPAFNSRITAVNQGVTLIDVGLIEEEYVLEDMERATDKLLMAPNTIITNYAAASIQASSLSLLYGSVLSSFLQRPSTAASIVAGANTVAIALSAELIGKWIPLIGVLQALQEVAVPHLDREVKKFENAATVLDRIFGLDDALSTLRELIELAQSSADSAKLLIEQEFAEFETNASRLLSQYETLRRP